jgi:hypothetical protein
MILRSKEGVDDTAWGKGRPCGERVAPRDWGEGPVIDAFGPGANARQTRCPRTAS